MLDFVKELRAILCLLQYREQNTPQCTRKGKIRAIVPKIYMFKIFFGEEPSFGERN